MNARADLPFSDSVVLWSMLATQWRLIDAPLRPCAEDVRAYEGVVADWQGAHRGRAVRGLLLGVTAEIATMRWPAAATLIAVDHSLPMTANVWPKPAHGAVVCADWRAMPLANGSCDVALGDGCLTLLPWPEGFRAFARNVRAALRDDGLLALRCFCRPQGSETPARVFEDLRARRIGGFHAFKWRLAMALHGALADGVRLADIWDCWAEEIHNPHALARHCGWPEFLVRSMELYRDSDTVYRFPTPDEVVDGIGSDFALESSIRGSYELAERCPVLVFRAR